MNKINVKKIKNKIFQPLFDFIITAETLKSFVKTGNIALYWTTLCPKRISYHYMYQLPFDLGLQRHAFRGIMITNFAESRLGRNHWTDKICSYTDNKVRIVGYADIFLYDNLLFELKVRRFIPKNPYLSDITQLNYYIERKYQNKGYLVYIDWSMETTEYEVIFNNDLFKQTIQKAHILKELFDNEELGEAEPSFLCKLCTIPPDKCEFAGKKVSYSNEDFKKFTLN